MSNQDKHRIAIIDSNKCKPKKCNHECEKACPVNASGKVCIEIEETIAVINDSLCVGCTMCVKKCPFGAIKIINIPSQIADHLVHSYGENLFKLYKLPSPKLGKIIGILGPNGCGKTTIMNILSKNIIPNFGKDTIIEQDVLKNVRGTELQKYLKKLYGDEFKINIKPQNIINLLKSLKDPNINVKEVLSKYQDYKDYNNIIKTLDIDKIYNNKITLLSGGELQKLVCAISMLKDGDVYIFDEPTNYLDIEYRIKVANLIKDLCTYEKYIFVVDHDLSIMDFVADYIHVMYGDAGAYGCVSTLYSTLEGINIYFDGYIPADNIRFRDEPYKLNKLEYAPDEILTENRHKLEYTDQTITFEHFELKINKSTIDSRTNIIVVLGKNGTGKTTYLNYLCKELGYTVSYKQQLNGAEFANIKLTVQDLLYDKIKDAMLNEMFLSDVIKLMDINKIYNKKVKKLSGGELQRLSLALCLGQPADVYLIDEPSASLDVEQRFNATKVIKRFLLHNRKIGFVVEHDILMAISIAKEQNSKIIVFEEVSDTNNIRYCQTSPLYDFNTGINYFLKSINTTFRSDIINNRPKINKYDSVKDAEQKKINKYYM